MRLTMGAAMAGVLLALLRPAAAVNEDLAECERLSGDEAIAGCSHAIASGKWKGQLLAKIYNNRGVEYKDKGDPDRAIADYDEAILLNTNDPDFFYNRANAWEAKGQLDLAIADYDESIRLDPKAAKLYDGRGITWQAKGDLDRAIADFGEAVRVDPKYDRGYFDRGIANLYAGALPKALADLDRAAALDPKDADTALWLDIVGSRASRPSRLAQAATRLDMRKWPAPVIRLYLGQTTAAAVLKASDDRDPQKKKERVCTANFYTGALALRRGDKGEAARLFGLAASDCPRHYPEWRGANAELKALGPAGPAAPVQPLR